MTAIALLAIFILAVFVGYEVISKVSSTLHTPLMSGANAIHGVILVGAILITARSEGFIALTLGFIAIVLATLNAVGGFVVTDRMLEMFKSKNRPGGKPDDKPDKSDKSAKKSDAKAETAKIETKEGGSTAAEVGTKTELEHKA